MRLRAPYDTIAADMIATIIEGSFPESVSDLRYRIEAILRKYRVELRPVPLDREEIRTPPSTCPICRKPTGGDVKHLGRDSAGEEIYCHPDCIFFKTEVNK